MDGQRAKRPLTMRPSAGIADRARSQGVSRGAHLLVNPREIGLLAMEETRDGVNQHGVGSSGVETAGFFEGQDPLHPVIALVTGRPQRAFAPQHPKTQGPLRPVVGRLDAMLGEKDPQGVHLTQQATGEAPRLIRACMILVNRKRSRGKLIENQ
jgi:hypothetical protein